MDDLNDPSDFDNQMISLDNPEVPTHSTININEEISKPQGENIKMPNFASMVLPEETQKKIAEKAVDNLTKKAEKTYIEKLLCFLNYFKQYFKVTTKEVQNRLLLSLKPLKNSFYEEALNKPDLYGPFWIYTTLIFAIASGGSLSKYFQNSKDNFFQQFIPSASLLIYIMGFIFPLLLWGGMKLFGEKIAYFTTVCIYGYSLSCFIPIMFICSCGIGFIQWIFLMYGIVNSTLFVVINFWNVLKNLENKKKYGLLGFIVSVQFILFLILKLKFFDSFSGDNKNIQQ